MWEISFSLEIFGDSYFDNELSFLFLSLTLFLLSSFFLNLSHCFSLFLTLSHCFSLFLSRSLSPSLPPSLPPSSLPASHPPSLPPSLPPLSLYISLYRSLFLSVALFSPLSISPISISLHRIVSQHP